MCPLKMGKCEREIAGMIELGCGCHLNIIGSSEFGVHIVRSEGKLPSVYLRNTCETSMPTG
jgi:hypothetical protein